MDFCYTMFVHRCEKDMNFNIFEQGCCPNMKLYIYDQRVHEGLSKPVSRVYLLSVVQMTHRDDISVICCTDETQG